MNYQILEFFAMMLTLISVLLTARVSRIGWLVGLVACVLYAIVFYHTHLYFQTSLQFLYLIQGILGLLHWSKDTDEDMSTVGSVTIKQLVWFWFNLMICIFMIHFMPTLNIASINKYDILTTLYSFFATYLLTHKKPIAWLYWFGIDIMVLIMCSETKLYISAALYLLLSFIAVRTFYKWGLQNKTIENV